MLRLVFVTTIVVMLGLTSGMATANPVNGGVVAQVRGDGCTKVPDSYFGANFRPACDKHDKCYSRNSSTDRKVCDQQLLRNLVKACKDKFGKFNPLRYSCVDMAGVYYAGVRNLGRSHYHGHGNPD